MLFNKIVTFFICLDLFLYSMLYVEFWSLPSLSKTMSVLTNGTLPGYISFSLLFIIILGFPIFSVVFILSNFKKFIFNHSKNSKKSYAAIIAILFISYLFLTFFEILAFLVSLAFKPEFYFAIRCSDSFLHIYDPYFFLTNLIFILISQSSCFILSFLITEVLLTYKISVITMTIRDFINKNLKTVLTIGAIILINTSILVSFQDNLSKFSSGNYSKTLGITDKMVELFLINFLLMYCYSIYTINSN